MRIYGCKKKEYIILATTCELSLLNSRELLTLFEKHPARFLAVSGLAFLCGRTTDTHPYIMQRISVMYNRTLIHFSHALTGVEFDLELGELIKA